MKFYHSTTAMAVIAAFGNNNIVPCQADHGSSNNNHNHVDENHRDLLFQRIYTYQPQTKITDVAAMDLDLQVIVSQLEAGNDEVAQKVYKDGGHSGSTAVLSLDLALDQDIPAGTDVIIPSGQDDSAGWGSLAFDAERGAQTLLITYGTTVNQEDFVGCQVGALPNKKTSGCFVADGTINFPDLGKGYDYSYDILSENINLRTFLSLSFNAKSYQDTDTFFKYMEYYSSNEYIDEIITAAFGHRATAFSNGRNMDFSFFGDKGAKEVIEISLALLTIWMTVVGSMEDAVQKCFDGACETEVCLERPGIFEWDSAVAYYSGSQLEMTNDKGNLLFYYADQRCEEFRTCGESGTLARGNAYVNHDIFHWFARGQRDILERYCEGAAKAKNRIIQMMTIPLVQGALRYAHMVNGEMESGDIEKHDAEAAAFALAVLPLVNHCNPADAQIIFDNLKPKNPTDVDFLAVKRALERNYKCMNIKCHHVGGIYDDINSQYKENAEPCHDLTVGLNEQQRKWVMALGISFGGIFLFAIIVCIVGRTERSISEPKTNNDLQLQPSTEAEIS